MRSNAMWLAANWVSCSDCKTESHPTNVRQWFNEQKLEASLPSELQETTIETKSVPTMDDRTAEKVGKLVRREDYNSCLFLLNQGDTYPIMKVRRRLGFD